jgi:hypothetical protein
MKKFLLLVLVVVFATISNAQQIRLNFYSSYVFDDSFGEYYGSDNYYNGTIKGGLQIGGGIQFMTSEQYGTELLYLYKKTQAPSTFKFGNAVVEKKEDFDVTLQYILLSGNRHMMKPGSKVEAYGGLMAGILINKVEAPSNGGSTSNTNFAWGGRLGANIWLSEKIGIKLQTQILSALNATGGELYYSWYGPVTVPDYSVLWQYSLGGGLVFKLGQ